MAFITNVMFYVYILEGQRKKRYIGYTANLKKRLERHRRGEVFTTKEYKNIRIIYVEGYRNIKDAKGRERFLKSGAGWRYMKKQLQHYLAE